MADKLDLIRKLLARAEVESTEAAAEAYNAKARKLMAEYGIDAAKLAEAGEVKDELGVLRIDCPPPFSKDKAVLCLWIGKALNCKTRWGHDYTRINGQHQERWYVNLYGWQSDRERTELLYTSLLLQAVTGIDRLVVPFGEHKAAYKRSWLYGYATAVSNRLQSAEREAREAAVQADRDAAESIAFDCDSEEPQPEAPSGQPTGTELVLLSREQKRDDWYDELFPSERKLRRGRATSYSRGYSGYGAGHRAGKNADLSTGKKVTGTGPRELV